MDTTIPAKIGKYEVISRLGKGGMGEVLLAQDRDLGRRVAIKRPFKSGLEDGFARFQVEARAATLRHPNIPAVYEMGEQDGLPYIAMEFVEGEALDKVIASKRPLDLIEKLSIIEQVCSALGHAHEKGIVHRDIKPANVILQADGVAKIIDFGIAKILSTDAKTGLTQASQIIGSLHYIAPERFKGETVDGRSDIFSAGVMLYLLLTGHLPFAGGEETASYRIVNESHTTLATYLHDYPPALDGILEQAMAKNPNLRYQTAEDFADDLHNVIGGLRQARVGQLLEDAERLTIESRYSPALELLQEATKLDPDNTQVKKMRRFVREHLDRSKRADRIRDLVRSADEALAAERFPEALAYLKEAQPLDPTATAVLQRIQVAEEKKRQFEKSTAALTTAVSTKERGDLTGALRIVEKALLDDRDNAKLLAARAALAREVESEAQKAKLQQLLEQARGELAEKHFPIVESLIREAQALDATDPEIDRIHREVARMREQEERRELLEEIRRRVNEFLRAENFEQASELLERAIDKLPAESMLHRLKSEVDAASSQFQAKRFVDDSIAEARELFAKSPMEGLALLQNALERVPGDERLIAYARSLRAQLDSQRLDEHRDETLRTARTLLADKQYEKAVGILESFRVEYGSQTDIDDLESFAKDELAALQRRNLIERCLSESRSLIQAERLEDAVRLLEVGIRETGDAALSGLLEEVRGQQAAIARRLEVLQKRVALLRERGEFDEALQLLQAYLAATPKSVQAQELLSAITAERQQKVVTAQAIAVARQALQNREFATGLEALQSVIRAYGDTPELTRGVEAIENARVAYSQEVTDKAIEAARAALLKNDAQTASVALKSAADWVGFTDQKRQADWQRILKSVKKANPDAVAGMPAAVAPAPARGFPIWVVAVAVVVVLGVVGFEVWRGMHQQVVPDLETHIIVTKGTPGATVKVDGAVVGTIDAKGDDLSIKVNPGQSHHIEVSKEGFLPISDDRNLAAGETYAATFNLPAAEPGGGNLKVHGNVSPVKVYVDDDFRGSFQDGEAIALGVGAHTVVYKAPGYGDSSKKSIAIAAGQDLDDTFNLTRDVAPPPTLGNLKIETTALASVQIDGRSVGTADSNGTLLVPSLTPTQHKISVSLDGYQPISEKPVTVAAGKTQNYSAQLLALPPTLVAFQVDPAQVELGKSVTFSWQVKNAASVTIEGVGTFKTASGTTSFQPTQTGNYKLIANGVTLSSGVPVTVVPRSASKGGGETPSTVKAGAGGSPLPSKAALLAGLAGYADVFRRASGGNAKACQKAFSDAYGGKLKGFSSWCELAAGSFEAQEACADPAGSADAPVMSCTEHIHIPLKNADPKVYTFTKTFHFKPGKEANTWQLVTFE